MVFLHGEFSVCRLTLVENSFIIFNSRRGGEIGIRTRLKNQARFASLGSNVQKCAELDIFGLCQSGGMADAADSKSVARKGVWVQVPPLVFSFVYSFLQM